MASKTRAQTVGEIPEVEPYLEIARATAPKGTDLESIRTLLMVLRTADSVLAAFEQHFAEFGISDGKFDVLMVLLMLAEREVPPTPGEIAELKGVNRSTITGLLDGLERAGLVRRIPHDTDRRALRIVLTEQGHELMNRLLPVHWQRSAVLMGNLTAEQQSDLVELLRYVLGGLELFKAGKLETEIES